MHVHLLWWSIWSLGLLIHTGLARLTHLRLEPIGRRRSLKRLIFAMSIAHRATARFHQLKTVLSSLYLYQYKILQMKMAVVEALLIITQVTVQALSLRLTWVTFTSSGLVWQRWSWGWLSQTEHCTRVGRITGGVASWSLSTTAATATVERASVVT